MARKSLQLSPRVRRLVMQGVLVLVFAGAVGLAALVTRHVTQSMRVELGPQQIIGRLMVRLPAKWGSIPTAAERGDAVEAEEPPGEGDRPGRRLRVLRQRADGLISPLEHLQRSGRIKAEVLRGLADGREGFARQNLQVAGWPRQMVSYITSPRPGVVHKDVVACAVTRAGQAVIVQLEGVGPVDESDRQVVRQMAENVSVSMTSAAPEPGGRVELADGIAVDAPAHYAIVPADDPNQLQRQMLFDGTWGASWVAADLAACIFFPDDADEALLAMLQARDPDWRSGPVHALGHRTYWVDRVDAAATYFPARAYLIAHEDGHALLVVQRGGLRDGKIFDAAWSAIGPSVKFAGKQDLSTLLANGAETARSLGERGLAEILSETGSLKWSMWDQSENADQEPWLVSKWKTIKHDDPLDPTAPPADPTLEGSRSSQAMDPYTTDSRFEQEWTAALDLSKYRATTFRESRRDRGELSRRTREQWINIENGKMTLGSTAGPSRIDVTVPAQFIPGALVPLLLQELAEKPCLIKTESFIGTDTVAPPGLLTLFITRLTVAPLRRDEKGEPMDCVSVSVNGTGVVSRWYYTHDDGLLRFIDFAGGMKAQEGR